MKKGTLILLLLLLSGLSNAAQKRYTGPDCTTDPYRQARITTGLDISVHPLPKELREKYADQLYGKDVTRKITRLSSEKISKDEAKRLMLRRAKMNNYNEADLRESGLGVQYLKTDLYRQYYLIESNKGFKAIGEFYSAYNPGDWPVGDPEAETCAADLEHVYIISEALDGHTADFKTR